VSEKGGGGSAVSGGLLGDGDVCGEVERGWVGFLEGNEARKNFVRLVLRDPFDEGVGLFGFGSVAFCEEALCVGVVAERVQGLRGELCDHGGCVLVFGG
jgi:hypothetical protein